MKLQLTLVCQMHEFPTLPAASSIQFPCVLQGVKATITTKETSSQPYKMALCSHVNKNFHSYIEKKYNFT